MAKAKATRPYEVPVTIMPANGSGEVEKRTYLVDAATMAAAEKYVSAKFVGEAKLATGKRVAELMGPPYNCKIETAEEAPAPTTPAG
jgi:hypothetical protein